LNVSVIKEANLSAEFEEPSQEIEQQEYPFNEFATSKNNLNIEPKEKDKEDKRVQWLSQSSAPLSPQVPSEVIIHKDNI
jgi:hypothetical protein